MKKQVFGIVALSLSLSLAGPVLSAEPTLTRNSGAPVGDNQNSQTAGPIGPTLLQDANLIEKLASFDRERIPERVVHARGVGAYGEFESFVDLSKLTMLSPLSAKGKKTPVFLRFSTVINAQGSPETLRDPRGFAVRFYSDQGNWDLVGNNLPVFFIRDAIKFPDMVHSLKPSPITNVQDPNRYLDFFTSQPASINMLTYLYSDNGTPASLRTTDGFGVHAFKLVNKDGKVTYVKFHWKSKQGIKNFTARQAEEMAGKDFNYHTNELAKAINGGNYPSWELYVQLLDPEKLDSFTFNPVDTTKIWPTDLVPEQLVGRMTLNRMPKNFFNETERFAAAPSNMIPGIEPSEDRLLQGRLFSYADTQRYRLGINHQQFPINRPLATVYNHNQAGEGNYRDVASDVNYQPSRRGGGFVEDKQYKSAKVPLKGTTQQIPYEKTDNFRQAGVLYRSYSASEKASLIENFAADLNQVTQEDIKLHIAAFCYKADADYGARIAKAVNLDLAKVKQLADTLSE